MAVIIDWVANHTSWDNDWIYNFDWYVSDASGNIIIPPGTNWQDVAELDYSSQAMRLEMIKSLKFWVDECNIDGFRFDAVDFVPADFWKQAIDSLSTYTDRNLILLAEGGNVKTMDAGFQMLYAWDFQTKLKHIFGQNYAASEIFQVNKNELSGLTEGKTRLRYITNHDIYAWEESPVESFQSKEGTLAAFAIASFLDGVPLICSGQEIAHPQTISFFGKNPLNWSINPEILLGYKDLMDIRTKEIKLLQGKLTEFKHNDVCCFSKTTENGEILVMVNVRNSNVSFPVPSIFISQEWSDLTLNASINFENKISLKAYEYRIFKSN